MNGHTSTPNASCCNPDNVTSGAGTRQTFEPAVDIYETAEGFVITADVPGATSQGIDITLDEGVLAITAKVEPRHAGESPMLVNEYGVGDFKRTFRVGATVDPSKITAEVRQGVLTVNLPKLDTLKPRKIAVQSNN